ncbi:hypothetical protein CP49_25830 [Bradyrhizobium valentinum]|uniref:Uncharacterized protein n=2 Tax=Bradyrhizobium valentinum TaxID=1518501 RepID=A0A0R3M2U2_9BRAD|nr:hypothetical protein CP49_25830 [Bradyrhizobium valentinum]
MVNVMDDRARAIFEEAREALENPGALGERRLRELTEPRRAPPVLVERRADYDGDDYPDDPLVKWRRGMVRAGVWPVQTVEDREHEVREALAKYQLQVFVDGRVAAGIAAAFEARAWRDDVRRDAIGDAFGEIRKQLRAEIVEQVGGLRADLTIEKAAERGDVVEVPQFLERRRA